MAYLKETWHSAVPSEPRYGYPLKVRAEIERLVDELEAHLTYEEEQLIPILDLA
ncbi:hypothetical protein [Nonomuraea sp. B5E05]|uniref:hypothetical protein n=1 Tax=Nonomuraea sp. B5E05 TaxID=3153569 RepID=UPI0032601339